jgi:hypothetical protein
MGCWCCEVTCAEATGYAELTCCCWAEHVVAGGVAASGEQTQQRGAGAERRTTHLAAAAPAAFAATRGPAADVRGVGVATTAFRPKQ